MAAGGNDVVLNLPKTVLNQGLALLVFSNLHQHLKRFSYWAVFDKALLE